MTSISGTAENGVRRGPSPAGHAVRLQLRASAAQNLTCQILRLHPDHAVRSYPQAAAVTSRCHRSFDDHHGYRDPVRQPRSSVRAGVLHRTPRAAVPDAEFRKTVAHEPDKPVWAAKPELTRLGAFLRYTRVDGLPQLLNV